MEVQRFRHTLVRLMSLCHGSALEEIAGDVSGEIQCIDAYGLDNSTLRHIKDCKEIYNFNRVEVLLHMTQTIITKGLDDGVLKIPPPILSRVYQTLSRGFVNLLNAKKIADTRFPFPYAQLITMLLLGHVVMTPLLISSILHHRVWAPILTFIPLFSMFYLNFVGVELENPFGDDENDLPLDHFQSEMNNCLLMLLEEHADLIPDISAKRCQLDFRILQASIRTTMHGETDFNKRISQFNFDYNIDEDDEWVDERPEFLNVRGPSEWNGGRFTSLFSSFSRASVEHRASEFISETDTFSMGAVVEAPAKAEEPAKVEVREVTDLSTTDQSTLVSPRPPNVEVLMCPPPDGPDGCAEASKIDFNPAIDTFLLCKHQPNIQVDLLPPKLQGSSAGSSTAGSSSPLRDVRPPASKPPALYLGKSQDVVSSLASIPDGRPVTYEPVQTVDGSLDDFREALSQWTAMIEGQLSELRHNTLVLKRFSDSIPQMLNSGKA